MTQKEILDNLKIDIDNESVNIWIDRGEDTDPISVCYWHLDEFIEDGEVAIPMAKAVQLYYTNPKRLIETLGITTSPTK